VARPREIITAAISQPVCSRVYTPPGTKLYATVQTENSVSASQTNAASTTVRSGGQTVTRSSIIGHTDIVYTASTMPPVTATARQVDNGSIRCQRVKTHVKLRYFGEGFSHLCDQQLESLGGSASSLSAEYC